MPIDKPNTVENERCLARAVLCFDSVYVGGGHVTVQVMVDEASLNFGAIKTVSLLPDDDDEENDELNDEPNDEPSGITEESFLPGFDEGENGNE